MVLSIASKSGKKWMHLIMECKLTCSYCLFNGWDTNNAGTYKHYVIGNTGKKILGGVQIHKNCINPCPALSMLIWVWNTLNYRVIQKSGRTLKMNNSKTNKNKKMRFAPNRWKRGQVLCGNQKKIVMLATNRWYWWISNIGYYKETNDIKRGNCSR